MNFGKSLVYSSIVGFVIAALATIFLATDFDEKIKVTFVHAGKKVKNFIYYEATLHNPEGDLVPDGIDDSIFSKAKSVYNK
ncbi:MAG: hypothetical protein ACD_56C00048G0005 [uncultured bacterium]|nr:MAG: hypothetical protein ACD_56C00048G0005 [uncultured bacterium]